MSLPPLLRLLAVCSGLVAIALTLIALLPLETVNINGVSVPRSAFIADLYALSFLLIAIYSAAIAIGLRRRRAWVRPLIVGCALFKVIAMIPPTVLGHVFAAPNLVAGAALSVFAWGPFWTWYLYARRQVALLFTGTAPGPRPIL